MLGKEFVEKDWGTLKEKWVTNVGGHWSTKHPLQKGVVVVINASLFPRGTPRTRVLTFYQNLTKTQFPILEKPFGVLKTR